MAIDPDGRLYVSSRFEGTVYRVDADGRVEPFATDLGVACGLAFAPDGTLFVGDRSGTIFRVDRRARATRSRRCRRAWRRFISRSGTDGALYVTGADAVGLRRGVSRRLRRRRVAVTTRFGRPQGSRSTRDGTLYVVEALAGASGLYRVPLGTASRNWCSPAPAWSASRSIHGGLVVCS